METGIVRRVIGPVVDVQFPSGRLPDIYNAIEVEVEGRKVVMECVQQLGDSAVRCVSLFSTDGMARGNLAVAQANLQGRGGVDPANAAHHAALLPDDGVAPVQYGIRVQRPKGGLQGFQPMPLPLQPDRQSLFKPSGQQGKRLAPGFQ